MAKKSRTNKRKTKTHSEKRRQQRHLHAVPSAADESMDAARNAQMVDSFSVDFVRWYEADAGASGEDALQCLAVVQSLVSICTEHSTSASATRFTPAAVIATLDEVAADLTGETEVFEALIEAWHSYVHYLNDRGRWTGSEEEYIDVHRLLAAAAEDQAAPVGPPAVDIPELTESEEASGFAALELIQRTARLMTWIGTGKQLTGTGALRLKDIEAAAHCVGIRARGGTAGKSTTDVLPGLEEVVSELVPDVSTVRSMYAVPMLSTIWRTLTATGLLTTTTTARPSEAFNRWSSADPAEKIQAYREYVTRFLQTTLLDEDVFDPIQPAVAALVMTVLAAGTTSQPVPAEFLDAFNDTDPDEPDMMNSVVGRMAKRKLATLAELGIITSEDRYRVAPVVGQCVAAVAAEFELLADDGEDDGEDDSDGEGETPPARVRGEAGPVLQLKISLTGATPPIWRRVLVPAAIRLSELHHVIQLSYEWMDGHLHLFSEDGNYRGRTYQPADNESADKETIDEATVSLSEVLSDVGDKLTYIYDFGDDWAHLIQLEKVLDNSDRELPVCLAGRGAAPAEDSGGVHGWAQCVSATNDPAHEEHEEVRERLGLWAGDTFDAKRFDLDEVNQSLDMLR